MVEILDDRHRQADALCIQGIDVAEQEKDLPGAHKIFQQAYEMDPTSAKINSWLGYTTAIVERKVQKGLELCRKGIDSQIPDAYFYRNIGKCYLLQSNKRGAVGAFAKGLQIDKGNRSILAEWSVLGFRRKPMLKFLDRDSWLNVKLGKFTWWLSHRK